MLERQQYSPYGYRRLNSGHTWQPLHSGAFMTKAKHKNGIVQNGIKNECETCNIAAHGFICHFSDGTCLNEIYIRSDLKNAVGKRRTRQKGKTG